MDMACTSALTGALGAPLPWQAEISFLVLVVLLIYTPHIIDSIRRFRESDDKHNQDHEDHFD
jgi:hypothetical protein